MTDTPDMVEAVAQAIIETLGNDAFFLVGKVEAASRAAIAAMQPHLTKAFTDGMEAAAQICGSLAETTYDDADSFEAATGCEAAIMRVVKDKRAEHRAYLDKHGTGGRNDR